MRPIVSESISCRKNVFLLKFSIKNRFFSTWNGLTNGWSHVYKMINLVWTNFSNPMNIVNYHTSQFLKQKENLPFLSFILFLYQYCPQEDSKYVGQSIDQSIYNIIHWVAGLMGQTTHRRSKYYFLFIILHRLRAFKSLYFCKVKKRINLKDFCKEFSRNYEKKYSWNIRQ